MSQIVMAEDPFDGIVATHHGEIYRYVRRITTRATEADDLSQETFLRAYRAYRKLPPDANVRAWLFAIATNLCRNHFRSEKRRRATHATVRTTGNIFGHGADEETAFNETRAMIEGAIATLPLKQRLAFTLRKLHDLDYDVIAQSLSCSQDSARAHVFQALRKIRIHLNGHSLPQMERPR